MRFDHIVAAVDDSGAGRDALNAARLIADRTGARVTALTAVAGGVLAGVAEAVAPGPAVQAFGIHSETVHGWAGIEVPRFAESNGADLVVLGRKMRSEAARRFLGDTADAVARRSQVPCLFVPAGHVRFDRMVVALDGSPRSRVVLESACAFATALGAELSGVTVEPAPSGASDTAASAPPTARSEQIAATLREMAVRSGCPSIELSVRRGDIVTEVLREAVDARADVLATGFHRGGPAGVLDAGSSARRLAHAAPMAFLSIPL